MGEAQAGGIIHGHTLLAHIGGGHFGDVWKAEFQGRTVAIKIFNPCLKASMHRREALAQYALGRLGGEEGRSFPHVEAIDLDVDPPYLRMEFVEGRPLEEILASRSPALDTRLRMARKVLQAVGIVHQHGFIHGDLSPSNILVTPDGGVKLIDVGYGAIFNEASADIEKSGSAEQQSMGVASPLYAAPERFRTEFLEGCGKPCDVFSFGKILYMLVTGEAPFVIKPFSRKFQALGGAGDDFLFRCLEEKPEARFADGAIALAEFDRVFRPEAASGEFRADCPECKMRLTIPGGWAGERFACRGCGRPLEVLFYDEESRHASTAVVGDTAAAKPDIEFIDEPDILVIADDRARKFCPSCGQSIMVEAKKCRFCNVWVEETARRFLHPQTTAEAVGIPSFTAAAFYSFVGYFIYYIPGVALNAYFLSEARMVRRRTGRRPGGMTALEVLIWIGFYLPAGFVLMIVTFLAIRLFVRGF